MEKEKVMLPPENQFCMGITFDAAEAAARGYDDDDAAAGEFRGQIAKANFPRPGLAEIPLDFLPNTGDQVPQQMIPAASLDSVCQPLPDFSLSSSSSSSKLSQFRKLLRKATYGSISNSINQKKVMPESRVWLGISFNAAEEAAEAYDDDTVAAATEFRVQNAKTNFLRLGLGEIPLDFLPNTGAQLSQQMSPAASLDSVCQPLPDFLSASSSELSECRLLRKATNESMSTSIHQRSSEDRKVDAISMANCLLLLSRMGKGPSTASHQIFECKTCNRQFSSLQALGGHSASHKRPKLMAAEVQGIHSPAKPKVHECPICGLEFSIGQALGGHMRRHRPFLVSGKSTETRVFCIDMNLTPLENDLEDRAVDAISLANCLMFLSSVGKSPSTASHQIFECKTCNKQFSSLQALGEHSASHKRPKLMAAEVQGVDSPAKPKVHECSICGLEFSIGQALGGHMRRHRPFLVSGKSTETRVFCIDMNLTPLENDLELGRAVIFR